MFYNIYTFFFNGQVPNIENEQNIVYVVCKIKVFNYTLQNSITLNKIMYLFF